MLSGNLKGIRPLSRNTIHHIKEVFVQRSKLFKYSYITMYLLMNKALLKLFLFILHIYLAKWTSERNNNERKYVHSLIPNNSRKKILEDIMEQTININRKYSVESSIWG